MTFTRTETHEERFLRMINEAIEQGAKVPRTIERETALNNLAHARKFAKLDIERKEERSRLKHDHGPGWPE